MDSALENWFQREILPHETALVRFLARKWVHPNEVQDIRHDIYIRVLEAAERKLPDSPRAFLFSVAHKLLVDRVRRERVVAFDLLADVDSLNVLIDELSPERQATGREQMHRLSTLFRRLPLRCRQVVWMRRIDDLPQKEIARRLGIAEATVEKHLMRGIGLLADALYGGADGRHAPEDTLKRIGFGRGK
ncbi:RNA polymerase sigma factor [Luteimonas sp. R10]|uniref:RNA polymerase sigma factor n=1 Tax=Luteimonas sp. R10 TaxID=3108176 RepID=UPI003084C5AF|nr:sigma-70 family RNA polymerase sigma factor [Luteimonas sp. R10]